jgi:hypothetical protein
MDRLGFIVRRWGLKGDLGHGVDSVYATFVSVPDVVPSQASGLMLPITEWRRRVV